MYGNLINAEVIKTGLDAQLIAAVIQQESSGNTFAVRYEPEFYKRYIQTKTKNSLGGHWPRLATEETERRFRTSSFGLMQMMGQVAREQGFKGEFLTELCDPAINLDLCCRFLKSLIDKTGSTERGLLRYNGGGDADYAKKVFRHIDSGASHRWLSLG